MSQVHWKSEYVGKIEAGPFNAKMSANGDRILKYQISFTHTGLPAHKELSAPDILTLQEKIDVLMQQWDSRYSDKLRRTTVEAGREAAEQATVEAQSELAALSQILQQTLSFDDRVDWESLKDRGAYEEKPFEEERPSRVIERKNDYVPPIIKWYDVIFGRRQKIIARVEATYKQYSSQVDEIQTNLDARHGEALRLWEQRKAQHTEATEAQRRQFYERQKVQNDQVDRLRLAVAAGEPQAVAEQASMVLERSDYKGLFDKDFNVEFSTTDNLLLLDYQLPAPTDMPIIKSVKFNQSTGEILETFISERDQKTHFDNTCYQICIRSLHEIFESDVDKHVLTVLFNGYARHVDRATGRDVNPCIMSVLVKRDQFESLDLSRIEPKACFKSLKGVSASSLAALAPVAPVIEMNREDRRFVEARDAASGLDESTNLAAMPWEDFEHLVRQLFEQEFATRGGEVKITQASRDGGVDAVAFDPDPITGGKIVIQAKRYTRPVSVSAIRDLFGTIMNEGASKGILVTTADFGPDAYAFAAGKPITLMSGSNLLHLLERHGHKAKIDIAAARKFLGALPTEAY